MRWAGKTGIVAAAACILLGILVSAPAAYSVEPQIPSSVDVYWKSTRAITVPGVSSVIVLDDEIAHVQIGNDTIEFAGLSRGETVALAYVNGAPVSIVVRVIEHPVKMIPPSLLRREAEMPHGTFGSDFQMSNSNFVALDTMSWWQQMGDSRLSVSSQFENNSQFGGQMINLRTGSVAYQTPGMTLNFLDFTQSLTGESFEDHINNFSAPSYAGLRGVDVTLNRGKDQYSFFAGSTIPYYFLSLNATRDIAGFSFHRKQSDRLNLFGGTSFVNVPLSLTDGIHRRNYIMQTAGLSYRLGKGLLVGAQGGFSNAGGLFRADASYATYRFSGYGSAIYTSQTFPLTQIQSLFSGTSAIKSGLAYRMTPRLTEGLYYEHTNVSPGLIYRFKGSSDYLSPSLGYLLARGESLNFGYTYSRNSGGFGTGDTSSNRYDFSLNSQLTQSISNSAQATIGSVQDPLQINSQDQFSIRDAVTLPIKGQTLSLGIEQDRVQPSLLSKLNQEISLLSPVLQAEFLANPTAFIDSTNFPPEVKALLAAEQPTGTTFTASSNLAIGSKLRLSPNVAVTHATNGSQADAWTQSFGYSLGYQLLPTLLVRSSLTNVLLFDAKQGSTVRTTILTFGFQKNFTGTPGVMPFLHRSRIIEGRVFRDLNINGAFNTGEPGLAGIEVRLEDGQVATTDSEGRYKFSSVSADQHQVSIDLAQFRQPIRMTTRSEAEADLIQQHIIVANFGVLDFARVMGSVYNDLRFDNHRQPDSKGMQAITLLLEDGKTVRKIVTSGSGDFELDDVAPGDYKLSLDSASLPPNFTAPTETFAVHVSPVSTVVEEIPTRALRSISGRVLLRMSSDSGQTMQGSSQAAHLVNGAFRSSGHQEKQPDAGSHGNEPSYTFIPLPDVEIRANQTVVKTDENGNFLIRNLPAGKVPISLLPVRPMPEGMKLPSGEVNLPADPIQVQGASIVISNLDLVPYLTERSIPNVPALPPLKTTPILQGKMPSAAPSNASTEPLAPTGQTKATAKNEQPSSPEKNVAAVMSPSPVKPVIPEVVPVSALPLSVLNAKAIPTPVTAPTASATPLQPSVQNSVATPVDCGQLQSLGDIARCYAQRKKHNSTGCTLTIIQ